MPPLRVFCARKGHFSVTPMEQQYPLEDCSVQCSQWKCHLLYGRYVQTLNIRIDLVADSPEEDAGDVIVVATTNGDGQVSLPDDRVMIKDWSENRDIVPILQAAGVIGSPKLGGYSYPVFPLLKKPKIFPAKPASTALGEHRK